jgi:hypothetical protein
LFKGQILSRDRIATSDKPNIKDYIATFGNAGDAQASFASDFILDQAFPTYAFWWLAADQAMKYYLDPSPTDNVAIQLDAYKHVIGEYLNEGKLDMAIQLVSNVLRDSDPEAYKRLAGPATPPERLQNMIKPTDVPKTPGLAYPSVKTPASKALEQRTPVEKMMDMPTYIPMPE